MQQTLSNLLKQKPIFIIVFLVLSISICSGQRDYYIRNVLPVTFHDNANQLYLAAAIGWGSGLDAVLSYSINDNFAIFATGNMHLWSTKSITLFASVYEVHKNDYAVTGGIMYFKNYNNNRLFETYLGYG